MYTETHAYILTYTQCERRELSCLFGDHGQSAHIHTYIYAEKNTQAYKYILTNIYKYTETHAYIHTNTYMYTDKHTGIQIYTYIIYTFYICRHMNKHTYMQTDIQTSTNIHSYRHTYMQTLYSGVNLSVRKYTFNELKLLKREPLRYCKCDVKVIFTRPFLVLGPVTF